MPRRSGNQRISVLTGDSDGGCFLDRGSQGKPVGAHAVPFLDQYPVGLEELADLGALPAHRFFQDGSQNGQGVGAEDGPPRDLRDVLGLRDCDGEPVAHLDV